MHPSVSMLPLSPDNEHHLNPTAHLEPKTEGNHREKEGLEGGKGRKGRYRRRESIYSLGSRASLQSEASYLRLYYPCSLKRYSRFLFSFFLLGVFNGCFDSS